MIKLNVEIEERLQRTSKNLVVCSLHLVLNNLVVIQSSTFRSLYIKAVIISSVRFSPIAMKKMILINFLYTAVVLE